MRAQDSLRPKRESTARSATRSKEIGVKKVHGAKKSQLIFQFLSESILFSLAATIIALALISILWPVIHQFTGLDASITESLNAEQKKLLKQLEKEERISAEGVEKVLGKMNLATKEDISKIEKRLKRLEKKGAAEQ